jgi:hypothetical protein
MDAVVTAEPAAIEYARALPDYSATALAWIRTYTLATPWRTEFRSGQSEIPGDVLLAFARAAVRADTRIAEPPFWWRACQPPRAAQNSGTTPSRPVIAYPRGDGLARSIAERLVALAWPATRTPDWLRTLLPADYDRAGAPTAQGLDARALQELVNTGNALAIVLPLRRAAGAGCHSSVLEDEALVQAIINSPAWQLTPLVDGRDYLLHRRTLGRIRVDADGTLRFHLPRP